VAAASNTTDSGIVRRLTPGSRLLSKVSCAYDKMSTVARRHRRLGDGGEQPQRPPELRAERWTGPSLDERTHDPFRHYRARGIRSAWRSLAGILALAAAEVPPLLRPAGRDRVSTRAGLHQYGPQAADDVHVLPRQLSEHAEDVERAVRDATLMQSHTLAYEDPNGIFLNGNQGPISLPPRQWLFRPSPSVSLLEPRPVCGLLAGVNPVREGRLPWARYLVARLASPARVAQREKPG
jgi:hypothetical protein